MTSFAGAAGQAKFTKFTVVTGFAGAAGQAKFTKFTVVTGFAGAAGRAKFTKFTVVTGFAGAAGRAKFTKFTVVTDFAGAAGRAKFTKFTAVKGFAVLPDGQSSQSSHDDAIARGCGAGGAGLLRTAVVGAGKACGRCATPAPRQTWKIDAIKEQAPHPGSV
ncbi:hypothetical protein [Sphingomonas pokkalii]|uniref:Uncharacterized protein n=1 Tax=Sphingomonas pokkalii TaxID=2175090 RepID=A0A2U0SEI5_9SPHN|nr:hypothetical protein [Sphingomonas pokkalii]PVX29773.1 hypothetical protein DD559_10920 [Sphingomonas pokkalii]